VLVGRRCCEEKKERLRKTERGDGREILCGQEYAK